MKLIKHILVAFDFSEPSTHALKQAIDFAKFYDAKVSVVHVMENHLMDLYGLPIGQHTEQEAKVAIQKKIVEIDTSIHVDSIDVFTGDAYFFILAKAQTLPADLIIIGSHGRKGLKRLVLGSIAEKIVKLSPVPVLVSRADRFPENSKILVPLDGSDHAEQILPYAMMLAKSAHARLQTMTAVDILAPMYMDEINYDEILHNRVQHELNRLNELNKKFGITEPALVEEGFPEDVIKEICNKDASISLVVLSTHSKADLQHFLLGGFSSKIVRNSPVSVLAVKPDQIKDELHQRVLNEIKISNTRIQ